MLKALTHDSWLYNVAAGGKAAPSALARSAHFLRSGSDTIHQRIFFAVRHIHFHIQLNILLFRIQVPTIHPPPLE